MTVLFIIGAGASASMNPEKIPVMANFFRLAAERIEVEKPEYWLPFTLTDQARLFNSNPTLEKLANEILLLEHTKRELKNAKKEIPEEILKSSNDCISRYKEGFLSDETRLNANFEKIFQKFLDHAAKTGDGESYSRFQYLVNILFGDLITELESNFSSSAYKNLAQALGKLKNPEDVKFISFNYEDWLEKALFSEDLWEPFLGYNEDGPFTYGLNVEDLESNEFAGGDHVPLVKLRSQSKKRPITILKPNGSLTWREADWGTYKASPEREIFLTINKSGCVQIYRNPNIYRVIHPQHGEHSHLGTFAQPLIHPPTFSKYRTRKMDWDVDRQIIEHLLTASTIVIIGWSMPPGDKHFGRLLEYALMKRMGTPQGQPPRLVICDKAGSVLSPKFRYHCYRLNSAFRCYETLNWSQGFTREFVDYLMDKTTNNGKIG